MDKPSFYKFMTALFSTPTMAHTQAVTDKQSGSHGNYGYKSSKNHNPKTGQIILGGTPKNRTSRCKKPFHRQRKK